jgi:hypothetical protein
MKPIVPCVWAPHQSSGTGGTQWRELVLDEQVADLRAIAVGEDEFVAGLDESGRGLHGDGDRGNLVLRGGAPVRGRHGVAAEGQEDSHEPTLGVGAHRVRCQDLPKE